MLESLRRRIPDPNVWLVYGATLIVSFAYGMAVSVIGLYLDRRGLTKTDVGYVAMIFAAGIILLSIPMGGIIRRFGAKRTLVASLLGYAVTVTVFPRLPGFASMAGVRFLDGAFSAGVWVASETILLARARDEHKAFATSLYAITLAMGYVVGPLLAQAALGFAGMDAVFYGAGALAIGSAILLGLRLDPDPPGLYEHKATPEEGGDAGGGDEPPALTLLWRIKTSCLATFSYGYFQATAVAFLQIYLVHVKGLPEQRTFVVMALFALGMLLFANPAGRLGDRFGHLLVMRALAAVGCLVIVGFIHLTSFAAICAVVFVGGASLAAISPVSLALSGLITEKRNLHRAQALYNMFYASGMLLGPSISSRIYDAWGGDAMLKHNAALWGAYVVFTVIFRNDDPRARRDRLARADRR